MRFREGGRKFGDGGSLRVENPEKEDERLRGGGIVCFGGFDPSADKEVNGSGGRMLLAESDFGDARIAPCAEADIARDSDGFGVRRNVGMVGRRTVLDRDEANADFVLSGAQERSHIGAIGSVGVIGSKDGHAIELDDGSGVDGCAFEIDKIVFQEGWGY